ncbi:MAG TPA: hypothetical protein DF383_01805 [Deltaproteobacteria bacterium]|nr:hypothetical protein [Deltaproteobacteria bacterium]
MKKRFWILCLLGFLFPQVVRAGNKIYQQPNNQASFVKLEKFKEKGVTLNHPYTFTEDQLKAMLESLRYGKKLILLKESKNRTLFEQEYIDKFASYLVEAFAKAKPDQAVVWSVVQKRPYVILRNDKLTIVRMWVTGSELHIDFLKVEAKLQGDYQAKTTGQRLIDEAVGVGVTLEPQQGQKFALDTTRELILDLNADWPQIAADLEAEDERLRQEAEARKKNKKEATVTSAPPDSRSGSTVMGRTVEVPATTDIPPSSAKDQSDAQARLTELKNLKDKGLITEKDYEKKKAEILKDL